VGLGNSRARLRQLYGDAQRFHAEGTATGFRVEFEVPYHIEAERMLQGATHP
jgi:hypothetical protein